MKRKHFFIKYISIALIFMMVFDIAGVSNYINANAEELIDETLSEDTADIFDASISDTPVQDNGGESKDTASEIEVNKLYSCSPGSSSRTIWYKFTLKEDGYFKTHFRCTKNGPSLISDPTFTNEIIYINEDGDNKCESVYVNGSILIDFDKEIKAFNHYYKAGTEFYYKVKCSGNCDEFIFYIENNPKEYREVEFNNDWKSANVIDLNTDYDAGFDYFDNQDWYKLNVNKANTLEIVFEDTDNSVSMINSIDGSLTNLTLYYEKNGEMIKIKSFEARNDKVRFSDIKVDKDVIYLCINRKCDSDEVNSYVFRVNNDGASQNTDEPGQDDGNNNSGQNGNTVSANAILNDISGQNILVGTKIKIGSGVEVSPKKAVKYNKKKGELTFKKPCKVTIKDTKGSVKEITVNVVKPALKKNAVITTPGTSLSMNSLLTEDLPKANIKWDVKGKKIQYQVSGNSIFIPSTNRTSGKLKVIAEISEFGKTYKLKSTVKVSLPKLKKTKVKIKLGKKYTLKVKNTASINIRFSSMNSDIATVDPKTGDITAVKAGTTTIQCFVDNIPYDCSVTVK